MITYGGPELFVSFIVIVITPLLYWFVFKRFPLGVKITSIMVLWTLAVIVAYFDVYQISREARRLCKEEAGLHVYKTVKAEGFLGDSDINYWAKYGFEYVETETIMGGKNRYTFQDGQITKNKVDILLSRYEYTTDLIELQAPINKQRELIRDIQTNELLGDIIGFVVYPGWLDRYLLGILGFTWIPPRCDGDYPPMSGKSTISYFDLVKAVIKPNRNLNGD